MGRRPRSRVALAVVAFLAAGGQVAGCGPGVPGDACSPPSRSSANAGGSGRPTRIAINRDDYHAKHVGHTADGRQFFLTQPFDPGTYGADDARVFVALYLFDRQGRFLHAEIDAFADRDQNDRAAIRAAYQRRLQQLGSVTFDRIEVEPFAVERFGTTFGLIIREPTSGDETWWVTAEPGDYMAFSAPWDCGLYDT